jgi:predicted peptidase
MHLKTTLLAALLGAASTLEAQSPVQTGFLDRTVTVAGVSYRYEIYVPADYTPSKRWPVIMFLHGSGERGSEGMMQTAVGLAPAIRRWPSRYPAIVVMPQLPPGGRWNSGTAQMAMTALDQTVREFATDTDRVYLTGLSLGGNGTWYLAYRYPERFAAIAPVCGFVTAFWPEGRDFDAVVPGDTAAAFSGLASKLRRIPVWIFHGEIDEAVPVVQSRRAAAALKAAGADVQFTEVLGSNHNVWDNAYSSPAFAAWLFAQRRHR